MEKNIIQKKSIKEWAPDERPREKLAQHGAKTLSNAELLAILIGTGSKNNSAIDLAKKILELGNNNLHSLGKLGLTELQKINGIGEAKAVTISAALELGKRIQLFTSKPQTAITNSKDLAAYIQLILKDYRQEVFAIIFLNNAHKIINTQIISEGGLTATVVDIRIILKKALDMHATALVLSHNHPSGNLTPSSADKDVTHKLKKAAHLLDINLLDHIIIGDEGYFSFADNSLL